MQLAVTLPLTHTARRLSVLAVAMLLVALGAPASAQQDADAADAAPAEPSGFLAEFLAFDQATTQKVVGLARAIPEDKLDWRPAEGVRSIRELLLHIGQTNYVAAASATALVGQEAPQQPDWATLKGRDALADAVETSFGLTRAVASGMASLDLSVAPNGGPQTLRAALYGFAVHHSEHLGQLIAYARSVGTVPPWSR